MRRAAALALALFLALSLSACEGSDDLAEALVTATPEPSAEPSPQLIIPGGPASVEAFGVAYSSTATLNPITGTSRLNLEIAPLMYEGLFEVTPDFAAEPVLCESFSHAGEVWTITIKDGVMMSDGEPLTAADVVYSLELARNSDNYSARLAPVLSAIVIDERTLNIVTDGECGRLELLLDTPVIRAGSAEEYAPAGSGLYTFVPSESESYLRASTLRADAPEIARIELIDTPEAELMISNFEQGTVSAASFDPTATDRIDYGGDYEEWSYATANMLYLNFGSWLDAGLRSILASAINREEIALTDLAGAADAASLPASPASALGAEQDVAFSLAESAAAFAGLGAETDEEGFLTIGGRRITVRLVAAEENQYKTAAARRIAEDWRQLGVDVTLELLSYNDYLARLGRGDFDAALCETRLPADFSLDALLAPGGTLNFGAYADPELDALLAAFRAADAEGIDSAAAPLYRYLRANAPIAPIAFERHELIARRGFVTAADPAPHNLYRGVENWEH